MKLSYIAVSGFQTFETFAVIPVRRITTLFGPNSAGKSAVRDAIEAFWRVLGDQNGAALFNQPDAGAKVFEALRADWRKTGPGEKDYANTLMIILGFSGTFRSPTDGKDITNPELTLRLDLTWQKGLPNVNYTFLVSAGWFAKVVLSNADLTAEKTVYFHRSPTQIYADETFVWDWSNNQTFSQVWGVPGAFSGKALKLDSNVIPKSGVDDWLWPLGTIQTATWAKYYDCAGEFARYILQANLVFQTLLGELHLASQQVFVAASRTVPDAADLRFLIPPTRKQPRAPTIFTEGLPEYRTLSVACFALANGAKTHLDLCPPREQARANAVNHQLSASLFAERGYRLDVSYALLISQSEDGSPAGRATRPRVLPDRNNGVILQLQLADAEGRRFHFTEVGSGLGYVLPVLLAVNASSGVACIQQPELHLHPALQSSLGDVFIEASAQSDDDSTAQLIIETHSEHIILRMLRRIRQTTNGTLPSPDLALTPDELAVVYFNPKPDGSTEVKTLAVTAEGDFADRWPRGFFNERDADLFDE